MEDISRTPSGNWEKVGYAALIAVPVLGSVLISLAELAGFSRLMSAGFALLVLAAAVLILRPRVVADRKRRMAADLQRGVFSCAIRFPEEPSGSLLERWNSGIAMIQGHQLFFQPLSEPDYPVPAGKARPVTGLKFRGPQAVPAKRPRGWGRKWQVAACGSDSGQLEMAASEAALNLLRGRLEN